MRKWVILLLVFLYGCQASSTDTFCASSIDCAKLEPSIDCVGSWSCQNNACAFVCGEGPTLELSADVVEGDAPLLVSFSTDVLDIEGYEEKYYCNEFGWDFGDGDKRVSMPMCVPFEEVMKQGNLLLSSIEVHTYDKPGVYKVVHTRGDLSSNVVTITVLANEKLTCLVDSDCVGAQCCHPTSLINKEFAPDCEGIACTMSCEGPLDCGQGKGVCQEGYCVIVSEYFLR